MKKAVWKRNIALLTILAMLAATVLTGCGGKQEPVVPDDDFAWATAPEETLGIAVDNAYMTFYYPLEWEGRVEELREETEDGITVTFQTKVGGKDVVLFSVMMGPGVVDGYLLGQLKDPQAGTINVYSIMNEIGPEGWSEAEYDEICALQERVNDIIAQFYEDERFVPSR